MNDKYRKNFLKAGQLAQQVRAFGKSLLIAGASYNDIIQKINKKIYDLGAIPAFPPQMALNYVAAHFLPNPGEDIILSDQVIKLDIGVCYQGAIGDCAVTVDLSGKHQLLVDAAESALLAAEKHVKVGVRFSEIGQIIEEVITARGFQPIRNLSGHGLGYYQIHTPPCVPNYYDGSTASIKPGMTFAIEPFATTGVGCIHEEGEATIFTLLRERHMRSDQERRLMKKMKSYNGLPFAMHECIEGDDPNEVQILFQKFEDERIIAGYPPLVEARNTVVAQAENSVCITQDGTVIISTR